MGNQQPSSEQEKVQRLSREGVGVRPEAAGIRKDDDIVRASVKAEGCIPLIKLQEGIVSEWDVERALTT